MIGLLGPAALIGRALMKRGGSTRSNSTGGPITGPNSQAAKDSAWYSGPNGQPVNPATTIAPTGSPTVAMPERNTVANIETMQGLAQKGVQGYGQLLGEDFRKDVGGTLMGLNRIGALRSGATQAGLDSLMSTYGRQVGAYSQMATRDAMQLGMQETEGSMSDHFRNRALSEDEREGDFMRGFRMSEVNREQYNYDRELRERDRANRSKKRSGVLGAIGGLVGGVGGFLLGGPPGAMAGASIGSKVGGGG